MNLFYSKEKNVVTLCIEKRLTVHFSIGSQEQVDLLFCLPKKKKLRKIMTCNMKLTLQHD